MAYNVWYQFARRQRQQFARRQRHQRLHRQKQEWIATATY